MDNADEQQQDTSAKAANKEELRRESSSRSLCATQECAPAEQAPSGNKQSLTSLATSCTGDETLTMLSLSSSSSSSDTSSFIGGVRRQRQRGEDNHCNTVDVDELVTTRSPSKSHDGDDQDQEEEGEDGSRPLHAQAPVPVAQNFPAANTITMTDESQMSTFSDFAQRLFKTEAQEGRKKGGEDQDLATRYRLSLGDQELSDSSTTAEPPQLEALSGCTRTNMQSTGRTKTSSTELLESLPESSAFEPCTITDDNKKPPQSPEQDSKPPALSEKQMLLLQSDFSLPTNTTAELDKLSEAMEMINSFGQGKATLRRCASIDEDSRLRRRAGRSKKNRTRRTQSLGGSMIPRQHTPPPQKKKAPVKDKALPSEAEKVEMEMSPELREKLIREILGESDGSLDVDGTSAAAQLLQPQEQQQQEKEEEEVEQQEQAPRNYNSYAARVARKQREVDASYAEATRNGRALILPPSISPTSSRSTTCEGAGKRAFVGDVQAEIASAQGRALESRRLQKSATAPHPPAQLPLTPPPAISSSSKHSVMTSTTDGGGSNVSSMDDSLLSHGTSSTTAGAAVTATPLTPFELHQRQMQQQQPNNHHPRIPSTNSQPGAFPTAGRAPYANPYLGGRLRGSGGGLFGETINAHNQESISTFNADLSMSHISQQLGNSSRHNGVAAAVAHVRRRVSIGPEPDRISDLGEESHTGSRSRADGGEEESPADNGEIVAVCVEEDDLENNIRDEIIRSAAQADVVKLDDEDASPKAKLMEQIKLFTACLLAVIIVGVVVGISVGYVIQNSHDKDAVAAEKQDALLDVSAVPSQSPTATPIPTLQKVTEAGVLRCGIYETTGFDEESGDRFGVDADWCRAVAAAAIGIDTFDVELVDVTFGDRFQVLASGDIDLLAASSTYTMDRNVYEVGVKTGLTFSTPYMYDGLRFAGIPEFVECADNDMKNFFECRDIVVCVVGGSSYHFILSSRLPKRQIIVVDGWQSLYGGLRENKCNVLAAEGVSLGEPNVRAFGYTGNYTVGRSLYSKIPLSIVTRDDDPQWSDFVSSVMHAVFMAEEVGITQETSHRVSDLFVSGADLFGDEYANMFRDVIAMIGNYAELYERHAASAVFREGLTLLNNGTTGLLFSNPFGLISNEGPGPTRGGTLERILERGSLRCAIITGRPGFAEASVASDSSQSGNLTVSGFDVDFCRMLATSLFSGSVDLIEFVEVTTESSGYVELASGNVDVLAGGRWSLQNDVQEPTTGQGFSFSQPYFYGADTVAAIRGTRRSTDENLCLVTRQDDPQWSTFVYWLVASTFYAEEMGLDQRLSNSMPEVHSYGPDFVRMLRDPILEFGNYKELYERNVERFIPRGGRNVINSIRAPGPQLYPVPGFLKR